MNKYYVQTIIGGYLNLKYFGTSALDDPNFHICSLFVEYDLFKTLIQIAHEIYIYMSFGITLTQFYINFLRQKHQIELILVAINS